MKEVRNTHDNTHAAPSIRFDINEGNLLDLPPYSSGPHGDATTLYMAARDAGFQGVQGNKPELCLSLGLHPTTGGRVDHCGEAAQRAAQWKAQGYECATLHVGTGFETDAEAIQLFEEIVEASTSLDFPLYIETHRATLTQDMWRTVQLTHAVPGIRFNGDFSHWYTGSEMTYGDFAAKLDFLAPVFDRVRFIHGRIGTSGNIQVGILSNKNMPSIAHFQEMWIRSCMGFLRTAQPGDYLCFVPELLGAHINYARLVPDGNGGMIEESDRWQEALAYVDLAKDCFREAIKRIG